MKNGLLKPGAASSTCPAWPRCARLAADAHAASGSAPRSPRASSSATPRVRGPYAALAESARAGRLRPGAQPGHPRRQPLQRRALGRHGAAAAGAGRRGRHRRAQAASGACRSADFFTGRPPDRARPGRAAGRVRRPRAGRRAAAAPTSATRRAASSTSRWSAWPPSSRSRTACCTQGAHRAGRGGARRRCAPPRPSRRWRASRSPPQLIEQAAELAVAAAQPDQRPARLGRVPPPPGPCPDRRTLTHRARAREPA